MKSTGAQVIAGAFFVYDNCHSEQSEESRLHFPKIKMRKYPSDESGVYNTLIHNIKS